MARAALSEMQPLGGTFYKPDGAPLDVTRLDWTQFKSPFSSHDGPLSEIRDDIVFKPGEFRIFSPRTIGQTGNSVVLTPGFNPLELGGDGRTVWGNMGAGQIIDVTKTPPKFEFTFSWDTYYAWNTRKGNTPGSFVAWFYWLPDGNPNSAPRIELPLYQHVDWCNTSQYMTGISPPGGDPFILTDSEPIEVGYLQLVLKGLHDRAYPTINWERDWRCRNWIQAPPFYPVKGLYLSENNSIADTQRIDSPYEFRFGPMSGRRIGFR